MKTAGTPASSEPTKVALPDFEKQEGDRVKWDEITLPVMLHYFAFIKKEMEWLTEKAVTALENVGDTPDEWNGLFDRVEKIWQELGDKRIVTAFYVYTIKLGISLLRGRLERLRAQGVTVRALEGRSEEWQWYWRIASQLSSSSLLGVGSHYVTIDVSRNLIENLIPVGLMFEDGKIHCLPDLVRWRFPGDEVAQRNYTFVYL